MDAVEYPTLIGVEVVDASQYLAHCRHLIQSNAKKASSSITLYLIRKIHNHTLQTNPRHREEEPQNNNKTSRTQSKRGKATSSVLPIKEHCKTRKDTKQYTTKHGTNKEHNNGSNNQQGTNNNRTAALSRTDSSLSQCCGITKVSVV